MIRLGLTGGIGCGKSVIADLFSLCGIPVYNCDFEAKRLMSESLLLRGKLIALFGQDTYKDGQLNRSYLAGIAFRDPEQLAILNDAVHPVVRADYRCWCESQESDIVVVESAILFDSGLYREVDKILTVTAPQKLRVQRVMQRDGATEIQIRERIQNQIADSERIQRSDFVVQNDEMTPLIPQLMDILERCR